MTTLPSWIQAAWPIVSAFMIGTYLVLSRINKMEQSIVMLSEDVKKVTEVEQKTHNLEIEQQKHNGRILALEAHQHTTDKNWSELFKWREDVNKKLERIITLVESRIK